MAEERVSLKDLALAERARMGRPSDDDPNVSGYQPPVVEVRLPSLGKLYPHDSPLFGVESLSVRAMTARDENILTSRPLLKKGTMLSTLMRACVTNKTVDPDRMVVGDRNAVLLAIRVSSYGPRYDVEVTCPRCDKESRATFDLAKLPSHDLGTDPDGQGQNCFSFRLPVLDATAKFKFLTGAEERELSVLQENTKKVLGGNEENTTSRLLAQLVSIGDEVDRGKLARIVPNLPARDSLELRSYMDRIGPRVDMTQRFMCPSCDEESEVDVPIGTEFFWPSTGR